MGGKSVLSFPPFSEEIPLETDTQQFFDINEYAKTRKTNWHCFVVNDEYTGPSIPYLLCILLQIPVIKKTYLQQVCVHKRASPLENHLAPVFPSELNEKEEELKQPYLFVPSDDAKLQRIRIQVASKITNTDNSKDDIERMLTLIGCRIVNRYVRDVRRTTSMDLNGPDKNVYTFVPMLQEIHLKMQTRVRQPRKSDLNDRDNPLYMDWIVFMIKKGCFIYPMDYLQNQSTNNSAVDNEFDNF